MSTKGSAYIAFPDEIELQILKQCFTAVIRDSVNDVMACLIICGKMLNHLTRTN
ncbi:MAG: hypothetical protein OES23_05605 [Nitrosopumilus sp.]|nr:hypothetical protein [Nitrosopumilus sp.]